MVRATTPLRLEYLDVAATRDVTKATYIRQLLNPVRTSNLIFTRDGKSLLISSNVTGHFNTYRASCYDGTLSQLTFSNDQHLRPVAGFPLDERILMTRDVGSCENTQLFILLRNGDQQLLQRNPAIKVSFLRFVPESNCFYCLSNRRIPGSFDLYLVDPDSLKWELIYRNDDGAWPCGISRDSKYLALMKIKASNDAEVLLYDFERPGLLQISSGSPNSYCRFAAFDPNSTRLYYLTDANNEWIYVVATDILTGQSSVVERKPFNILQYRFSASEKYLGVFYDRDGGTHIELFDRRQNRSLKVLGDETTSIGSLAFSPDDRSVAYFVESNTMPPVLYHHDLESGDTREIRLPSLSGQLSRRHQTQDQESIVAECLHYSSFDGLSIPSLLWRPRDTTENKKLPALIWIHGGPGGQVRTGYNSRIQLLARAGYVVLGCNYRGSFGYGRGFFEADIGKRGYEPLWDIVHAKKFLCSRPDIDETRIGIIGSSFGGYMVLAALAFHPDEFSVGVDICGVSDWVLMLETLPVHWSDLQQKSLYQKIGHPERDRDKLRRMSPLFYAEQISKPLMVLHGANDRRVPKIQSDQMVEAVKQCGGTVEYHVFPDEAHGLRQPENLVKAYQAILDFLARYL